MDMTDLRPPLWDERTDPRTAEGRERVGWRGALWTYSVPMVCAAGLVLTALSGGGRPDRYFQEHAIGSHLSALVLLCCSTLALSIFRWRRASPAGQDGHAPALWLLIAVGFLYLTADELFQFHELADLHLHHRLGLPDTALSDRIDDLIVLSYGLIGLCALWRWRAEARHFAPARGTLATGFALFFLMTLCDLLSNRYPASVAARFSPTTIGHMTGWAAALEDSIKLTAEWAFVVTLYRVRRTVKAAASPARISAPSAGPASCYRERELA